MTSLELFETTVFPTLTVFSCLALPLDLEGSPMRIDYWIPIAFVKSRGKTFRASSKCILLPLDLTIPI